MRRKHPVLRTYCKQAFMSLKATKLLLLFLLLGAASTKAQDSKENRIIVGKGWGDVSLGAKRKVVDKLLGKFVTDGRVYDDVYFVDYLSKGIQVSFNSKANTVHAIYFYNKQFREQHFAVFQGKTEKGIHWKSTLDEVLTAYGKPINHYSGDGFAGPWHRLVYEGIDFRFESEVLVRIGIPGK